MNTRALVALALPALMLVACSDEPEPAPVEENIAEFEVEEPMLNSPDPMIEPSPLPIETPTPAPTPTPEPLPDEAQIQFDAEATGMTSRVDRSAPPEDAPVPVQE